MKKTLASIVIGVMVLGIAPLSSAFEGDFGLSPSACKAVVADYMDTRLIDPRSARVQLNGDPYQVLVNMRTGGVIEAWAVDVRVKSRLPSGSWSNYQPYTVIFQEGRAVALEDDVARLTRV